MNPSFEDLFACPMVLNKLHYADNWTSPLPTTNSTPDIFNTCSNTVSVPINYLGYQNAHSGDCYAGIVTFSTGRSDTIGCAYDTTFNYREYLQGELITPLIAGKNYVVSMWISTADTANFVVPNFGVHFSNTKIGPYPGTFHPLPYTPQLTNTTLPLNHTTSWKQLEWVYQAVGGENYMIIGNFDPDSLVNETNNNCYNSLVSFNAYYYIDDVRVADTVLYSLPNDYKGIPTAFTPNNDQINDYFKPVGLVDESVLEFTIYNYWGQQVYGKESFFDGWDGRFNGIAQPNGVYLYLLKYKLAGKEESILKGYFTLIR